MASDVLCGNCGAVLPNAAASCPRCGRRGYAGAYSVPQKSPWTAALLAAVVPGLGQFYLGDYRRGLLYLVGTLGLEFFGFDMDLTAIGALFGVPMELGGFALWAHGIWDAWNGAKRQNASSY